MKLNFIPKKQQRKTLSYFTWMIWAKDQACNVYGNTKYQQNAPKCEQKQTNKNSCANIPKMLQGMDIKMCVITWIV